MTILAMLQSAAEATPENIAHTLKVLPISTLIGEGAPHTGPDGQTYLLYGPAPWTLDDVADCGWALAHVPDVADLDVTQLGRRAVQVEARRRGVESGKRVPPSAVDLSGAGNAYEAILRAQAAPVSVKMLVGLENWIPGPAGDGI